MGKIEDNKPFPIRLGELKSPLQKEAAENDRPLSYWIKKILREYLYSKTNTSDAKK